MAPSGNPHQPKQATQDEVVAVARRLMQRLSRHLDALEAGEVGAVDDVAAVLRTLLAHGEGDNAIQRLCRMKHIPLPLITVSEPVSDHQQIGLAFGAVPALPGGDEPVRIVDTNTWRGMKALIIRNAPRRVSTWEQIITAYANTYGSHLSGTIPHLLSHMSSICHSGPLDLGEYLIHCAGLVAEDALEQTLGRIDTGDAPSAPRHRRLNPLIRLIVLSRRPDPPQMTAGFTLEGRPFGTPVPIAKVRLDDAYIMLELTPKSPNEADFHYEVTNDKPEWWTSPT